MKPSLYGKNPGKLKYDVDYINNCSEIELFILVNAFYEPLNSYNNKIKLLNYLNKMKKFYHLTAEKELENYFDQKIKELEHKKTKNIEELESDEWAYPMDFCILKTARFGTKVTYNPTGRVIITDEFLEWYNNWQSYITYMDNETLLTYRNYRYEGKNLDMFRLNYSITKDNIEKLDISKPYKTKSKSIKQTA